MKTLRETIPLLHRAASPARGLPAEDLHRVLRWAIDLARDLGRLHREGRWHGAVGPDVVRIRGDRARLDPPGENPAPVEFRDPEAERLRHKAGLPDPACEARQDVYGLGALLYTILENGAPPCGSMSALTRPAPEALAWIVGRALAEGNGRYPTAAAMRGDLERLLLELRGGAVMETPPDVLPSFSGGELPAPRRLTPYRVAAKRERRSTLVLIVLALVAFGIFAVAWRAADHDAPSPPAEASASPTGTPTLPALLDSWRARLSERLAATGEHLDALEVPLLVISDVPLPRDLGWTRYPSPRLAQDVRTAYDRGATPAEIRDLLAKRAGDTTVPAALRVREGAAPDLREVVLDYRGLRFTGVAVRSEASPRR